MWSRTSVLLTNPSQPLDGGHRTDADAELAQYAARDFEDVACGSGRRVLRTGGRVARKQVLRECHDASPPIEPGDIEGHANPQHPEGVPVRLVEDEQHPVTAVEIVAVHQAALLLVRR